ncbi:MAG: hypothetical protein JWM47_187 [Acidimicrobiales bacterium]|nr:hypothetical protein [Acidimicrobiales bacterium]
MHAIPARSTRTKPTIVVGSGPFPWEEAHAAPEDRAVGLELELIELVARRRALSRADDGEAALLDAEIDRTLAELGSIVPPLAG